jgi:hypothetical protein
MDRMEEIIKHIKAAHEVVSDLCHNKLQWIMHIPADPKRDPDLIIGQALRDADLLLSRIEELEEGIKNIKFQILENFNSDELVDYGLLATVKCCEALLRREQNNFS